MSETSVLDRLHAAGLTLSANGDNLQAGPAELLDDELRNLIRERKAEILDALRARAELPAQPTSPAAAPPQPAPDLMPQLLAMRAELAAMQQQLADAREEMEALKDAALPDPLAEPTPPAVELQQQDLAAQVPDPMTKRQDLQAQLAASQATLAAVLTDRAPQQALAPKPATPQTKTLSDIYSEMIGQCDPVESEKRLAWLNMRWAERHSIPPHRLPSPGWLKQHGSIY
jgi:hypothetical protein